MPNPTALSATGSASSSTPGQKISFNSPSASGEETSFGRDRPQIPSIELPSGGGALKSIDEKFEVNAANGTAALSVPLPFSKTRSQLAPALTLGYDSGRGNGPLGLGWSLGLTLIQRRTDKLLPRYRDSDESDVFVLTGSEDLVPAQVEDADGNWHPDEFTALTGEHVKRYRPRIETDFARIERITPATGGTFFWKITSRDNVVTLYGKSTVGRIADPLDTTRVFNWLPELSYDDKGNCLEYGYLPEDFRNVPRVAAEGNRLDGLAACANTYLKWVKYGNATPYLPSAQQPFDPIAPNDAGYLFQMVVDYGDHDQALPSPEPQFDWPCRLEPFSRFKAGFEIRTYRLCQRLLFFHFFKELNDDVDPAPYLVCSLDFAYRYFGNASATPSQLRNLEVDYPIQMTRTHYRKNGAAYDRASFPPLSFSYQELAWNRTVEEISRDALTGSPTGLSTGYQWVDLWSEGIAGILSEQGDAWFFKRNLGDAEFGVARPIAAKPSFVGLRAGSLSIQDLEANGCKSVVVQAPPLQGFFRISRDEEFEPFQAFDRATNASFSDPYVKFVDLDGDGRADLLVSEDAVFRWYPNEGARGYGDAQFSAKSHDEERGPAIVFSDPTESIYLADMTGDGLSDVVRIRNGEVCYWPNVGFGRFGAKVVMDSAPLFDNPDRFDPQYLHLSDISGTGATDILYLGQDRFRAWLNQAGNGWSDAHLIEAFPPTEPGNQVTVVDLLGHGTGCVVWSSSLPAYASKPMRYVDLMGGRKPYLLAAYANGMGKSVEWEYKSSTFYYLQDERAGSPWATKLPFPVQCVAKISSTDAVTRSYLSREYSYHHGYYDPAEREYRGFGRVEQTDSETFDTFVLSGASNVVDEPLHQSPVLTKTWYHTGVFFDEGDLRSRYRQEYFQSTLFAEHVLITPPAPPHLSAIERREAARACKGTLIRQEVYGLDGSTEFAGIPFSTADYSALTQRVQPRVDDRYAVFVTTPREVVTYAYERGASDPRVAHTLNTRIDELGNVLESASVSYPRQAAPPGLPTRVGTTQARTLIRYTANALTGDLVSASTYRLRQACESQGFELLGVTPASSFFTSDEIANAFADAAAIGFEAAASGGLQKRLLKHSRTIFLENDLSTPLPLGQMDSLGLRDQAYHLALTDALASTLYGTKVTAALLAEGQYASSEALKAAGLFPVTDSDDQWWVPSGRALYPADAAITFYQPTRFVDPFSNTTTVSYDDYQLRVTKVVDPLGNTRSTTQFDWRLLAPQEMLDFNDNLTEVRFDIRGFVVGMAMRGKGNEADDFTGFVSDLTSAQVAQFFSEPATYGPDLLQHASSRFIYDLTAAPARVATVRRETHFQTAQQTGIPSKLQYAFEYSGGFGQVVMKKVQCKPGLAKRLDASNNVAEVDTTPALRWLGTGRTVFNNKGNPVLQYEPYFSVTFAYEDEPQLVEIGVTKVIHYDALSRVVRTDLPNGTFSKEILDAWTTTSYDPNDTVLSSQWYIDRTTGALSSDPQENGAAQKASLHDDTPVVKHLDGLGRAFYRVDHNRFVDNFTHVLTDQFYETETILDIEGNATGVVDPRGNLAVQANYDMLANGAHTQNMDSGERWTLTDVSGQRLYRWDSKQQTFHSTYDALRRSIGETVLEAGALQPLLYERSVYGEGQVDDTLLNLRGRLYQRFEPCGRRIYGAYDFKYNLLAESFTFTVNARDDIDWSLLPQPALEGDVFASQTQYDALNRPIRVQGPSASAVTADILVPAYNETRQLQTLDAYLRGSAVPTHFVTDVDYNEKGQRERIGFGNGVGTIYKYDPLTFRLIGLVTARNADPELFWDDPSQLASSGRANNVLQFLRYTFDPVGNPTFVSDLAQEVIYFANARIDPSADYTYDAVYRLIKALGREHMDQGQAPDAYDVARIGNPQPGNGMRLQRYTQQYAYDAASNLTSMGNVGSWSRSFTYAGNTNRLLTSPATGDASFTYSYDAHGCMQTMPQLSSADSDFADRLRHIVISASATASQEAWYGYGSSGERMRKVVKKGALIEERLYLGPFERFRRYNGATIAFERETLHVMDDTRRIAMVETPTIAPDSDERQLIRYPYSNHLGSACVEVDDVAQVISYEEYYPFGSTSYQGTDQTREVPAKRYRFTGKERDEESGLEYHGARYFAPWLARWTQPDPAGLIAGTNRYCYANDNPVRLTDPNGMQPKANLQDEVDPPDASAVEMPKDDKTGETKPLDCDAPHDKPSQPTIYNAGPTQTAFVPGDVCTYTDGTGGDPTKHPTGSVAFEGNLFVLPARGGQVTSYAQIAGRWRTDPNWEHGFVLSAGGVTGSQTGIFSAGYQFHEGSRLDTRDDAPFQQGNGHWLTLSLGSTPQENPQTTSAANLTGNYTYAHSFAWGGGNTAVDLNAGAAFAARGSVLNRDVYGLLNPYVGLNVSHQFDSLPILGKNATINIEATVGPNMGATLVNPAAGDPRFPIDLKANFGLGVQKQVGSKGDYTLGFEVLGSVESLSTIPGSTYWTAGFAATLAAY